MFTPRYEKYEEIRSAAEEFDTEKLDSIFAVMEEYSIPDAEADRWGRIKSAYEQLDYSVIGTLLS